MKLFKLTFLKLSILLVFISFDTTGQPNWVQKKSLPDTARSMAATFVIGTKAYLVTGSYPHIGYSRENWEYNSVTDQWTQRKTFPGPERTYAIGFAIGNKGYVCGGSEAGASIGHKDLWEYDPSNDSWTAKANFPGAPRDMAIGFSINNKGYYGTGRPMGVLDAYEDFWQYDPSTNLWSQLSDVPGTGRMNGIAFVVNGKGYVGYGWGLTSTTQYDLYEFDPLSGDWTNKSPANFSALTTCAFSVWNKGYVGAGGINGGGCSKGLFEYDPIANTWTQKVSLPAIGRCSPTGFVIGNTAYLGFGDAGDWQLQTDLYSLTIADPSTSINILSKQKDYNLYPNPSKGIFTLGLSESVQAATVNVTDGVGKVVHVQNISNTEKMDLSHLREGIYLLRISTAIGSAFEKISIH